MNDTTNDMLPELTDATIARIEEAVFTQIDEETRPVHAVSSRARIRRKRWLTAGGIAAAFVVGVLVTPPILGSVGGGSSMSSPEVMPMSSGTIADRSAGMPDMAVESSADMSTDIAASEREIIATARATVRVKDIPAAASEIADLAEEHGGYVESTDIGKAFSLDGGSNPAPADSGFGWISIRVPSADLTTVISALSESGEVLSSSTSKQDVTSTAIDLRARVDATRASVERLTALMAQSGSVSELIEAEVALTDRQAQLESYEQQLAALDDQVAMSSVNVELTRTTITKTADPAGFGDGLLAGWNGLIVSLNALVIAVGFLLPWLGVGAIVFLVIWFIRRARRRRSMAATTKQ